MTRIEIFRDIERRDPDGWETEPKGDDYSAFQAWVIHMYGQDVWQEYMAGAWEPGADV